MNHLFYSQNKPLIQEDTMWDLGCSIYLKDFTIYNYSSIYALQLNTGLTDTDVTIEGSLGRRTGDVEETLELISYSLIRGDISQILATTDHPVIETTEFYKDSDMLSDSYNHYIKGFTLHFADLFTGSYSSQIDFMTTTANGSMTLSNGEVVTLVLADAKIINNDLFVTYECNVDYARCREAVISCSLFADDSLSDLSKSYITLDLENFTADTTDHTFNVTFNNNDDDFCTLSIHFTNGTSDKIYLQDIVDGGIAKDANFNDGDTGDNVQGYLDIVVTAIGGDTYTATIDDAAALTPKSIIACSR